jgi:hypothetical protein
VAEISIEFLLSKLFSFVALAVAEKTVLQITKTKTPNQTFASLIVNYLLENKCYQQVAYINYNMNLATESTLINKIKNIFKYLFS